MVYAELAFFTALLGVAPFSYLNSNETTVSVREFDNLSLPLIGK